MEGRYRRRSFWLETAPGSLVPRPSLSGDIDVDVAIVGAGYTGLWTAYYLRTLEPSLRVAVLEREIAGFGASGRNGGWCSALTAMSKTRMARRHGRDAAVAMQRAMHATVDEVGRVCEVEAIDAHFRKGGTLTVATTPAHLPRIRAAIDEERAFGFDEEDLRWLEPSEARERIAVEGVLGAAYTPHCARVHPARLARGLAEAVERHGATIHERTEVLAIEPHAARTAAGRVTAEFVIRATEGFTATLPGMHRDVLPLYARMIVTEPLPAGTWARIGWREGETLADARHAVTYAQRTQDDRIAFGGGSRSSANYLFGSRLDERFAAPDARGREAIRRALVSFFPALAGVRATHAWGGPIGVPRDWYSSVGLDRGRGYGWAGGYVGDGVATANLAGRTLADLVLGRDTGLVRLPWVGHRSPRWEPEPLRFAGVTITRLAAAGADPVERRTGRPARRTEVVRKLVGRG